jgi:uncharacterized repeat protein (TIGR03803 family)
MSPSGKYKQLHVFLPSEGLEPSGLALAPDGAFYGTGAIGGTFQRGTIFKMAADGSVTVMHSFNGGDGQQPVVPPTPAADGNLYGTTWGKAGTMYRMTPAGELTTLIRFHTAHGAPPDGVLVQGKDGNFYGVTERGGDSGDGSIFKVTGATN